jgi:hypothetical protein
LFIGADTFFPTASHEILGTGKYSIGPAVAGSAPMPRLRSLLFVLVQDVRSVGGDPGRSDVHYGVVQTIVNTIWSENWWTTLQLSANANWELNNKTGGVLEAELGRRLGDHWRLFVRPGVGLWGQHIPQAYDWNVEAGARWMISGTVFSKSIFEWFHRD